MMDHILKSGMSLKVSSELLFTLQLLDIFMRNNWYNIADNLIPNEVFNL